MVCRHSSAVHLNFCPWRGREVLIYCCGNSDNDPLRRIGPIRLCHKGYFPTKDKMAVGPLIKDPLHNSLQKILYNGPQYTILARGQPPYEGQNGWAQPALYSEVPLCCACFYIRLSIVTPRTWSPGLCLLWMKACTHG